jgi:hypothetical protein
MPQIKLVKPKQDQTKPEQPQQQQGLDLGQAQKTWGMLLKKQQLEEQRIASPEKDRELARIRNVLPAFFSHHGPQLVHTFIQYITKHVPLRNALIPLIVEAQAMMEYSSQAAAQHAAQQQKEQQEKGKKETPVDEDLDNYDSDGAKPEQGKPETDD